ncbi:hypothetical protein [Synechococcus elongatus]|uniref:hypothetical protein n=1 Tax=Synechococcus elongatus TaxID=32046 RepID=UPI000F7EA650|nr:hypothetical protein [Synechococcus elongatus]
MASKQRHQQIKESLRSREAGVLETMVCQSFLSQMRMFMTRQGVEFYAKQDSYGFRRDFLQKQVEYNTLDQKMPAIIDHFVIDGKGLFFFRPTGDIYRISFFPIENYRAYYTPEGDLELVEIIYSFRTREPGLGAMTITKDGKKGRERWIRMRITYDKIEQETSDEKLVFDDSPIAAIASSENRKIIKNSLGFIPAIEVFNNMHSFEMDAQGDFDPYLDQIAALDDMVRNVRKNLSFFGNPTLVSSRPKSDIIEIGDLGNNTRPSIASQAGFYSANRPSTRVSQPYGQMAMDGQIRVPRVIANLEPTDRVSYIVPDAVSGDLNLYVRQYREEILTAMGAIDELSITAGATAFEIKSLFGRAAATAKKKATALYDHGLCRLFEMMVFHEEKLFRKSFGAAIGLQEPVEPVQADFPDEQSFDRAMQKYESEQNRYGAKLDEEIGKAIEAQQIPPGVVGLIPDGDRRVAYRFKGQVFEDSTEDILNQSIVCRNLQELGVDSLQALEYLFPDRTPEERATMLSGYPFRMVSATQQSFGYFLNLIGQLFQTPHPEAPDLPLAADPSLNLIPMLFRSIEFLNKELSYAGRYQPADPNTEPRTLSAADRLRDARDSGLYSGTDRYGLSTSAPVGPDYDLPVPVPGSYLGSDWGSSWLRPGSLPLGSGSLLPTGVLSGSADLSAPTNMGVPFPVPPEQRGRDPRSVSRRNQRR